MIIAIVVSFLSGLILSEYFNFRCRVAYKDGRRSMTEVRCRIR